MTGEAYRDDANDPHALRLEADHLALEDHTTTSAQPAHRIIATHLWTMLRDLGFTEGRVLALGDDAATFIGLPHTDGSSPASVVADITDTRTPSTQFLVQLRLPKAHDRFDVVIASLPYNDVRLQDPGHVIVRRTVQAQLALTLATLTRSGGYTILLASHDLMDQPFPEARRHLHPVADLLGAVRLPAGAHRRLPGLDSPTDLLVLRHRPDGESSRSQDFERTTTIHVDDRDVEINTYFENNISQVLGTVGADPLAWGPAAVTISSAPDRLGRDLAEALSNVTAEALRAGLAYTPDTIHRRPQRPPVGEPIRQRDRQAAHPAPHPHPRSVHRHTGLER
ncbi:hypothetical protein SAMN05216184_11547 [Georgenia satyanarayanai]|uniref:Uncharacterized protein n=1 Tax=Georgenia satyanarayanai TaxID=860221 RepID=A0A2Y9AV61_9MICO|nr:hypothetical protein [Georgenia satyanarayanai]PYF97338.1 hypothetical protein A8987_11547 [Georgenia satyanarayanai]SSA46119.1 hypothetical protein SAMN05216184_11547 [Georgenia satyanarayanai]